MVNVLGINARRRVLAKRRQVAGYLPVEERGFAQFGTIEPPHSGRARLAEQYRKPFPVRPALFKPLVGENDGHGADSRSA